VGFAMGGFLLEKKGLKEFNVSVGSGAGILVSLD
jgi:hypothetical protein